MARRAAAPEAAPAAPAAPIAPDSGADGLSEANIRIFMATV
jgi:hypothetical protein